MEEAPLLVETGEAPAQPESRRSRGCWLASFALASGALAFAALDTRSAGASRSSDAGGAAGGEAAAAAVSATALAARDSGSGVAETDHGGADLPLSAQDGPTTFDDATYEVTMKVWTKYVDDYGEPGHEYTWMSQYDGVVEPWRDSYLIASCTNGCSEDDNRTYVWTFDDGSTTSGDSVLMKFTQVRTYSIGLSMMVGDDASPVTTSSFSLVGRYVRREVRQLSHDDRELFLETMKVLWSTASATGRQLYGAAYTDVYDLAAYHTELASDQICDHMHDGLGFLTQHIALSLSFEQSMQAVNPRVSLPYWDFTIDKHLYDVGNKSLDESPMWHSEWFGKSSGAYNTIEEGRWSYIEVLSNQWGSTTHNSYGYMRAPWNNNNRPYVTRAQGELCGMDYVSLPSCEVHWYTLDKTNSWYDFGWVLPYEPHGPVHMYVGGALNCNSTMNLILDYFTSLELPAEDTYWHQKRELEYLLRTDMFLSLKNMYRAAMLSMPSYCSIDTPFAECHGTCTNLPKLSDTTDSNHDSFVDVYWTTMFAWSSAVSHYEWLSTDVKVQVITMMCSEGIGVDGDQLEAGSPMDPSFWSIHPTMERLWTYKKITGTMDSEDWPKSGFANSDCFGHNGTDEVPFRFALKTTTDSVGDGTISGSSSSSGNADLQVPIEGSTAGGGDASQAQVGDTSGAAPMESTPDESSSAAPSTKALVVGAPYRWLAASAASAAATLTAADSPNANYELPELLLGAPSVGQAAYTNLQIYNLADPDSGLMPYIYGDFNWHHCTSEGWDMSMAGRVPLDDQEGSSVDGGATEATAPSGGVSATLGGGSGATAATAAADDGAAAASRSDVKDIRKALRNIQMHDGIKHMHGGAAR